MMPGHPAISLALAAALTLSTSGTQAADLLITNAMIYTVNPSQPWAEAMVVDQGEIIFIGNAKEAESFLTETTQIIDLNGRFVMPGIHDVHMHPLEAGNLAAGTCMLEAGRDPETYHEEFIDCAPRQIGTNWVLGWGHYIGDLLDTARPPVEILDQSIHNRPALMMEFTSHSHWANSQALKAAGITADTPNPPGGIIVKDPDTGHPNGILIDNAGMIIEANAHKKTPEFLGLMYEGLLENLELLAENGITSVVDARSYWTRDHHTVWQRAEREGTLTARVNLALWAYPELGNDQMETMKSLYSNNPESLLRINQVKVYSDGIVGNTTAKMKAPYKVNLGLGIEGNRGLNYFNEDRLALFMAELEKTGFDFLIHTIGDQAVHESLNAIERVRNQNGLHIDRRHRLTHVEIADPFDLQRFQQLDAVADFQVAGDWTFPEEYAPEGELIGHRADNPIPLRSVFDTGARITLSSDYDVSPMNPFIGMEHALTRGEEALPDLSAVIKAYTINGAYTMRQEDRAGSLEVGKLADFIVLDQNLFDIPTEDISKTRVLATFLEGENIYQDEGLD
ncbi:amidohydrolase [Kiloniella laminariae]|uniref:Amidohydrolase n=1 Tax=Kiloniella laminariae TaxID=454162 RepID=A0ABT4LDS8_9PROT|nr:amidohydrolase [Kiloniella laminariae]MCZ4279234.1 amidohydrolase [Kiloniella laminariae]